MARTPDDWLNNPNTNITSDLQRSRDEVALSLMEKERDDTMPAEARLALERDIENRRSGGLSAADRPVTDIYAMSFDDVMGLKPERNARRASSISDIDVSDIFAVPERSQQTKPDNNSSDIARGFGTAFKQVPQLGYGLMAGAGAAAESAFGEGGIATGIKKAGVEGYKRYEGEIEKTAKPSDSLTYSLDKAKEGDFGAFADWLQYGIGYGGAQALQAIASGGIGSILGKATLKKTVDTIASGMVAKEAARIAASDVEKKLAADQIQKMAVSTVASNVGRVAGIGAQAFGMEGGEIFGDLTSQDPNKVLSGDQLAKAFGATLAAGGLEFVADKLGVDLVLGKSGATKFAGGMTGLKGKAARTGIGMATQMPTEAGTEYLQTGLEEYGKGKEAEMFPWLQSASAQRQAFDAAGLGAVGGGVPAVVGGAFSKPTPEDVLKQPTLDSAIQVAEQASQFDISGQSGLNAIAALTEENLSVQRQLNQEIAAIQADAAQDELAPSTSHPVPLGYRNQQIIDATDTTPSSITPASYRAGNTGLIPDSSLPIIGQPSTVTAQPIVTGQPKVSAVEERSRIEQKQARGEALTAYEASVLRQPPSAASAPQIVVPEARARQEGGTAQQIAERQRLEAMRRVQPQMEQDAAQDELAPAPVTMKTTPVQAPRPNAPTPTTQTQLAEQEVSSFTPVTIEPTGRGTHDIRVGSVEQAGAITQMLKAAGIPMTSTKGNDIRVGKTANLAQVQAIVNDVNTRFTPQRSDSAELQNQTFQDIGDTNGAQATQAEQGQSTVQSVQPSAPQRTVSKRSIDLENLLKSGGEDANIQAGEVDVESLGSESDSAKAGVRGRMGKLKAKALRLLMGMFGRKVVYFEADRDTAGGIHREGKTIYVNVDAVEDPLAVVNHEFSHSLEHEHGGDYRAALKAAVDLLKSDAARALKYAKYYNKTEWIEGESVKEGNLEDLARELIGDITGNDSRNGSFWSDVFEEIQKTHRPAEARSIISRLRDAIVAFIDKLIKATPKTGFDLENLGLKEKGQGFTREDLQQVRDMVIKMAAKSFVNAERRALGLPVAEDSGTDGEVRFSTANREEKVAKREDSAVGVVSANPGAGRYVRGDFTYKGKTLTGIEKVLSVVAGKVVSEKASANLSEKNSQKWERLAKDAAREDIQSNGLDLVRGYLESAGEDTSMLDGVTNNDLVAYFDSQRDAINADFGPAQPPAPMQAKATTGDMTALAKARIRIHEGAVDIIKSNKKWIADLFGLKNMRVTTVHGSFEGNPELSFAITADNMTPEIAQDLVNMLGVGFVQDQVVHRTPTDPSDPNQFVIPSIIIGNKNLTKLTDQELSDVKKFAAEAGLDYTETTANDGLLFHYFGPESGVDAWQHKVSDVGVKAGLPRVIKLKLSSDIYDANIQQGHPLRRLGQNLREGGDRDSTAGSSRHEKTGWQLLVDRILAPYVKLISANGFRVSPERFALRYGLTQEEAEYLRNALYPKGAEGSVAPILYDGEVVEVIPSGSKQNKPTNQDVGFALANRATQHGQIEPGDYSDHAANAVARVFADEVKRRVEQEDAPGSTLKKAKGWYEATLTKALHKMAEVFPELAVDSRGNPVNQQARFIFNGILAITSQGMDVVANFKAASVYYGYVRQDNDGNITFRKIKPDLAPNMLGDKTNAIQWNLQKFQEIIDKLGWQEAERLMLRKESVAQLNKHIKEELGGMTVMDDDGKPVPISVAGAARRVSRGWSVFGPKIGSFANNLYGDYSTLTADLWFSRSWNRVLGYVFLRDAALEAKQLMGFRDAIKAEFDKTWHKVDGQWELRDKADREVQRFYTLMQISDAAKEDIARLNNSVSANVQQVKDEIDALKSAWKERGWKTEAAAVKADPANKAVMDDLKSRKSEAEDEMKAAKSAPAFKKELKRLQKQRKDRLNEAMALYSFIADADPDVVIGHMSGNPDALFDLAYVLYRDYANYGFKRRTDLNRAAKNFFEGSSKLIAAPRSVSEGLFQQEVAEKTQHILRKKYGMDINIADIQALLWFEEKDLFRQFGAGTSKADSADYAGAAEIAVEAIQSGELVIDGEYADVTDEEDSTEQGRDSDVQEDGTSPRQSTIRESTASYGQAREGSISVTGIHFSKAQRSVLDSRFYGTGMSGEEASRLKQLPDELRYRINLYVNEGSGVTPESDVGNHAHSVTLRNIYDAGADPLFLSVNARGDSNKFERSVKDAGFDGYYVPSGFGNQGVAVLLGYHTVKPEYHGTEYRAEDMTPPEKSEANSYRKAQQTLASRKDLPSGQMKGSEWKKALPELDLSHLKDDEYYYKDGLVKRPSFSTFRPVDTESPEFIKWFGDSKVVDADGKPLRVYHGTASDFTAFDLTKTRFKRIDLSSRPSTSDVYARGDGGSIMPLYVRIENPATQAQYLAARGKVGTRNAASYLTEQGYDGVVDGDYYQVFSPAQIKSAISNSGEFSDTNPDIRFSTQRLIGDSGRQHTQEQLAMFKRVGRIVDQKTILEKLREWIGKKWQQGIFDQFAPFRQIDQKAYTLMRLAKGATGAFEAFMKHGKLSLRDGTYDADTSGGVINDVFIPLGKETTDFLYWVAGHRAERLAAEGKERLYTPQDIAAAKSLANGTTDFDYTLSNGQVTRDRTLIYRDSLKKFNEYNKNVMDMAEQSGLIDGAARHLWEHEFYVPFYRVMEDDELRGMGIKKGIVRQEAFKKLKGGEEQLGDLLSNTLMNWAHLIDASAKNRAAKAAVEAAENVGIARPAVQGEKQTVWFLDGGQKKLYRISDQSVMEAITGLEYSGMHNMVMDVLTKPKHWLTIGVTASPFFKVRNLIRDSVQAIATSDLSYNAVGNVIEGYKLTNRDRQEYVSALAGGGLIRFGTMLEGNEAARTRQLVKQGSKDANILNGEGKLRQFYDKYIEPGLSAYNEIGNRGEEINRMSLYQQMIDKGMDHATASLMARDLMDFSLQGSFNTIRFLAQVVPFFNARIQGMYKLGRASKENREHMAIVTFSAALAGLAMMAYAAGDDDRWKKWKKREEWDKANYWMFEFGGMEFRIPRPFELGAVAHIAERSVEAMLDSERDAGKRYGKAILDVVKNQLSMNPAPQAFKPIIDIYANKDSFTDRPIETMSMQRLDPTERYTSKTSMPARWLSNATPDIVRTITGGSFSPVQYDQIIRGYFGWIGATAVASADMLARSVNNEPTKPALDYWKFATGGMVQEDPNSSRYVSLMYDQAKELEQAHATFNRLRKEGRLDEAVEYRKENAEKLNAYRSVEHVKKMEAQINEQIRAIERSDMHPAEKRIKIRALKERQSDIAERLSQ